MQDTVRIDRDKYIGGSDIPAIMGISQFKSRFELLQEKAGIKGNTFNGNAYTEYGQAMEEYIRNYINAETGDAYEEGKHYSLLYKDGKQINDIEIRCHTDGEDSNTILEIKTTSQTGIVVTDYKAYLVQLLFYMFWAKKPLGILAVYHRPEDMSLHFDRSRLNLFFVKMADYTELVNEIMKAVYDFIDDLHRLKENPFLTEQDFLPNEVAILANGVAVLERKIAEYRAIEEEYKRQKESLLRAMQEAGVPSFETDNGLLITAVAGKEGEVVIEDKVNLDKLKAHKRIYKEVVEKVETVKGGRKPYLRITERS